MCQKSGCTRPFPSAQISENLHSRWCASASHPCYRQLVYSITEGFSPILYCWPDVVTLGNPFDTMERLSPEGGCSKGLDAFRCFLNSWPHRIYLHARDLSFLESLGPCGGPWATPNPQHSFGITSFLSSNLGWLCFDSWRWNIVTPWILSKQLRSHRSRPVQVLMQLVRCTKSATFFPAPPFWVLSPTETRAIISTKYATFASYPSPPFYVPVISMNHA